MGRSSQNLNKYRRGFTMALTNNFISPTSLVFGVRDFLPQIESNQKQDREGLQNAFKFATQVYDFAKNREVADAIKNGDLDKAAVADAQRINNQDPTSIFRWKLGQEQAKQMHDETLAAQEAQQEAALQRTEAEKAKAQAEQDQFLRNKISATLPTMGIGWNTSPEQLQQYKNTLAGLKTEAMNRQLGDELNNILEVEAQLNGQLPRQRAQMAMDEMEAAKDRFNIKKEEGGFGKDPDAYHNFLLQQYTKITRDFPEAKYDPAFNKAFRDADKEFRKKVKPNVPRAKK